MKLTKKQKEQIKAFEKSNQDEFDLSDAQSLVYFFEDGEALGNFYGDSANDDETIEEVELLHAYYSSKIKKG